MTWPGWRNTVGYVFVLAIALVIAATGFVLRFNAMGGAQAGFDDEEFNKLTRANLVLAGEQPLRDFTDGELRGVWPSLTYELPALAQRQWGRNLLTHAVLTCGILAFSALLVFFLARSISGSIVVAIGAGLAMIASYTHLYNYPKVVTLSVAVALIRWAVIRPTLPRVALLAAWTVVAALFRHDLGVYVAVGAVVGLVGCEWGSWHGVARRLGAYAGLGLLFSLPSAVWVAYYAGIPTYIRDSLSAVGAEGRRLSAWPVVEQADPLGISSLIAFNYYAFWALAFVAALVVSARVMRRTPSPPSDLALGAALVALTLVANYFFLRSNLPARFGDAMAPVALLAAWLAAPAIPGAAWRRRLLPQVAIALVLLLMSAAFVQINEIERELSTGRFTESADAAKARFYDVAQILKAEPPIIWTEKPVERNLAVSRYLAECTADDDRVLLATFADDVAFFARRQIAGGQRRFTSNVLKSEADQRRVLARLAQQSVPVVVTDPNYRLEFVPDYPLVAEYIEANYRDVGTITSEGRPVLDVWVETARRPVRTDAVLGFPCYR